MTKRISIGPRPRQQEVEAWVGERRVERERRPLKRLTIDIDEELHQRIRLSCFRRDRPMAEVIRDLLSEAFPEASDQAADSP